MILFGNLIFGKTKHEVNKKECDNCKKQHTMDCPNSYYCYNTETKPYFEERNK